MAISAMAATVCNYLHALCTPCERVDFADPVLAVGQRDLNVVYARLRLDSAIFSQSFAVEVVHRSSVGDLPGSSESLWCRSLPSLVLPKRSMFELQRIQTQAEPQSRG